MENRYTPISTPGRNRLESTMCTVHLIGLSAKHGNQGRLDVKAVPDNRHIQSVHQNEKGDNLPFILTNIQSRYKELVDTPAIRLFQRKEFRKPEYSHRQSGQV